MLPFLTLKKPRSKEKILHQPLWWMYGFINAMLRTFIARVGQRANTTFITVANTWDEANNNFLLWEVARVRFGFVDEEQLIWESFLGNLDPWKVERRAPPNNIRFGGERIGFFIE